MSEAPNLMICPVCQETLYLSDEATSYCCQNNHFFDIARQGYINLLTSNQKKSLLPGDSKDMVFARREFLNKGHYENVSDKLNAIIIRELLQNAAASVSFNGKAFSLLDLGCGEGYYTNRLLQAIDMLPDASSLYVNYCGIDISKEAIRYSSSANKRVSWIVGTNFHLPFQKDSFNCIFSVFSPVMASECNRILKQKGIFIRILPGTHHLIEIRDIIYAETILSPDTDEPEPFEGLEHVGTEKISYQIDLNQEELIGLVQMTPHYWKTSQEDKNALKAFSALRVTVSMMIYIYQKP